LKSKIATPKTAEMCISQNHLKEGAADGKLLRAGKHVKARRMSCVSLIVISPLTAVLKCPHDERGHCRQEPERGRGTIS
jgi:hypothetical protein